LNNRLGIAVAGQVYRTYRELLTTPRWQRIFNAGARPQRLLWASTGTKDPKAADTLYVQLLSAPFTIDTMPEPTLVAFAEHGVVNDRVIIAGNDWETVLDEFVRAGVDLDNLAIRLQNEGASSFTKSWREILTVIAAKGSSLESQ
jgi:transaldolase